jgi:ubiquinone/menaquinone biosynthesis C-methylase UbiE
MVAAFNAATPLDNVLELACGPGTFTGELADRATSVTALDASPEMLKIAAARTGPRQCPLLLGRPVRMVS